MATQPMCVEFVCDNETLKFTHNVPVQLIESSRRADDSQYMNIFVTTIKSIIDQRYQAAFNASQPLCSNPICGSPKTRVVFSPTSFLYYVSDPRINVLCCSACNEPDCDARIKQDIQSSIAKVSGKKGFEMSGKKVLEMSGEEDFRTAADRESSVGKPTNEVMPCRVCKTTVNTLRCATCEIAFYCGRQHQKMDWPIHKKTCKKVFESNS